MSALDDAIHEAVRAALSTLLPTMIETAVAGAVARLRVGDGGDDLIDTEAAARALGMTPAALRRAAERGRAPVEPVRIGRRLRWRRADILAVAARDKCGASGP